MFNIGLFLVRFPVNSIQLVNIWGLKVIHGLSLAWEVSDPNPVLFKGQLYFDSNCMTFLKNQIYGENVKISGSQTY